MGKNALTKVQATVIGIVIIVAACVGAYYYVITRPQGPSEMTEIKLGLVFPLTGPMAPLGTEMYRGVMVAIELINERGGVLGKYPVRYVVGDAKSDPAVAASEAERLITVENVPIIVGFYSSALCLSASEVCERYKVIAWSLGEVSDEITCRGYKYTFACTVMGSMMPRVATFPFLEQYVCPKLGVKMSDLKVAIIYEDGPYGTSVASGCRALAQEYGMEIVLDEGYSSKATDLSSLILKLIAAKPDVLLATSYVSDAILFFKQAKELGFKTKVIIGHGGGHSVPATQEALGPDINGIFSCGGAAASHINWDALLPEAREIIDDFVERFEADYGYKPVEHATLGFAHMWPLLTEVLPKAIEKYGGVTPDNIRKAALEVDIPMKGVINGGGMKFSTEDEPYVSPTGDVHVGRNIRAWLPVNQWQNQTIYVVWPEEFSLGPKPIVPLPPESPYAAP